jgi:hypothetical protein
VTRLEKILALNLFLADRLGIFIARMLILVSLKGLSHEIEMDIGYLGWIEHN